MGEPETSQNDLMIENIPNQFPEGYNDFLRRIEELQKLQVEQDNKFNEIIETHKKDKEILKQLLQKQTKLQSQHTKLSFQVSRLQNEFIELQESNNILNDNISKYNAIINKIHKSIDKLNLKNKRLMSLISQEEMRINYFTRELEDKISSNSLYKEIQILSENKKKLEEEYNELYRVNYNEECINNEIEFLISNNQSLANELNDLTLKIKENKENISKLKESQSNQLAQLQEVLQNIMRENEFLDTSSTTIESEILELKSVINSLEINIKEKETQFKKMLELRKNKT